MTARQPQERPFVQPVSGRNPFTGELVWAGYEFKFRLGKGTKAYSLEIPARVRLPLAGEHVGLTTRGFYIDPYTIPAGAEAYVYGFCTEGKYAGKFFVRIGGGYRRHTPEEIELLGSPESVGLTLDPDAARAWSVLLAPKATC